MDKISIIIPVYYNEDTLANTYAELRKVCNDNSSKFDYEPILVDDKYKWPNFDETRKRPTFIIEETRNC